MSLTWAIVDVVLFAIAFRCALKHRRRKMFSPGRGQGRSQDFFFLSRRRKFRPEAEVRERPAGPRAAVEFLRRVQPVPPHQLGSPGSAVIIIIIFVY